MYKTRFQLWGVKKYRVANIAAYINDKVEEGHAQRKERDSEWKETLAHRTKDSTGLEPGHAVNQHKSSIIRRSSRGTPSTARTLRPIDIPPSWEDVQSPDTAMSSVDHTPDRSQNTSRSPSSGKASIRTPDSFESWEEHDSPPSASLETIFTLRGNQNWLGTRNELEACPPRPRRSPIPLRNMSQYRTQDVFSGDYTVADQIAEQGIGLLFPSSFRIPTPTTIFQSLMQAPLPSSIFPLNEFTDKLHRMRISYQDTDLVSHSPEAWGQLCLHINVFCGQQDFISARYAMLEAALVYQRLVREGDDQILSMLSFVLAMLFLHGQADLAAEILSQAQIAASLHLHEEHPIQVSIKFMIFMALKTTKTCGITIPKLRQVVEDMNILCGGKNHRYCVTSTYHLAWRLAMEPDMRLESLEILRQTQVRSEAVFGPGHMQTVALLTTQARVLGHLGRHVEAEKTMLEALRRIEEWDIKEDHPYLVEAKERYVIFERRSRLRCR
jgi:hypothetical protein